MPDLARPLVRDHARADRRLRHALLVEELAVVWVTDAGHDVAADALLREVRGGEVPQPLNVDFEALAGVDVREFVAEAQVAVGDVRDAPPPASDGSEHAP